MLPELRSRQSSLSSAYGRIAALVLDRPEEALRLSISALAERAGVSEPTVVRFCRELGCAGFRDFKLELAQDLGNPALPPALPITTDDSVDDAIDKIFRATAGALERLRLELPRAAVQRAADVLARARWVHIHGFGASASVASDAQQKLFRLVPAVAVYLDVHMQAMAASTLGPDDVVITISNSGRTRELLETASLAAEGGATIIAITRPGTPLAALASIVLPVAVDEVIPIHTPMMSRLAHLVVMDALVVALALSHPAAARPERLQRMKDAIERRRVPDASPSDSLG
jgi:RpiR family carbohydrate utilization transcriptional regulator